MNLTMNLNIERSTKINQTRILRMAERNKCVDKVKEETKEQLLKTIVNPTNYMYKAAIKNIIIQVSIASMYRRYLMDITYLEEKLIHFIGND